MVWTPGTFPVDTLTFTAYRSEAWILNSRWRRRGLEFIAYFVSSHPCWLFSRSFISAGFRKGSGGVLKRGFQVRRVGGNCLLGVIVWSMGLDASLGESSYIYLYVLIDEVWTFFTNRACFGNFFHFHMSLLLVNGTYVALALTRVGWRAFGWPK